MVGHQLKSQLEDQLAWQCFHGFPPSLQVNAGIVPLKYNTTIYFPKHYSNNDDSVTTEAQTYVTTADDLPVSEPPPLQCNQRNMNQPGTAPPLQKRM